MNILLLYSRVPYPIDQGANLRVYYLLKEMVKWVNIHLVCYGQGDIPKEISSLNIEVTYFSPLPKKDTDSLSGRLEDVFSFDQLSPYNPEIAEFISQNKTEFDALWCYTSLIRSVPKGLHMPIVVDVIDDGILEYVRALKIEKSLRKKVSQFKWAVMNYFFEKKYLSNVKASVLVSEIDASYLKKACPGSNVKVIQNGVDSDFYKSRLKERIPKSIVFEGNMSFPPNIDAVIYFASEIFPYVLKLEPEAKFTVVGKNPAEEVVALESENIRITGYVDDTRPYLDEAVVFVSPMRKGGGIKNKILQAWSMEKPVVATTISAGGLEVDIGNNIILEDDPQKYASVIVSLFGDDKQVEKIGRKARETVLQYYSWNNKAKELLELFK